MADNFGLKIGIDGEQDFKNALTDINQSFKVLNSEMKVVASQFDKNDNSVNALTSRNEVLNKQIDAQKEKIKMLKEALSNASKSFGENDKRTKSWEIQLNNAQASLNTMERELKQNNNALENSADDFDDAKKSADKFGDEIKKTGNDADSASNKFESVGKVVKNLSVAMASAVAAIGAAAVATSKQLWDMANDVAETGDEIDKMSQKIGLSAEAYQEWDYVFERSGADIDKLQAGMKTLSSVITDAADGSDSAAKKLEAVGLSIEDLNGKSQDEQLSIVISALQSMESGAERTAAAADLFGKSATDMGAVLNLTAEETAALKQEAQDYGMVMSDEAVKASAAFEDSLKKLDGTVSGLKNRMIGELLPGLTLLIDGFSDFVAGNEGADEKIKEGINSIIETVQNMIPQFLGLLSSIAGAILENAPSVLESLINSIISYLPSIFDLLLNKILPNLGGIILKTAKSLITSLIKELPNLFKGIASLIKQLVSSLFSASNIKSFVSMLLDFVDSLIDGLSDALPILIDAVFELANGIIKALPEIVSMFVKKIPDFISKISSALTDNLPALIEGAVSLFMGIVQAIPEIVVEITKATPQIIMAIVQGLKDGAGAVLSAAGELFFGIEDNYKNVQEEIQKTNDEIKAYADTLSEVQPQIADYNSLLSDTGNSLDDLNQQQTVAENGITEILKTALQEQGELRDEDLVNIQEYMDELARINQEKMEIYRSQQVSELKKLQLESGEITQETAAQHLANTQEALDKANEATEDAYTSRLTIIEQKYKAMGEIGSQAYKDELDTAKDEHDKQIAENERYYAAAIGIIGEKSQEWVDTDADKWEKLSTAMSAFNNNTDDEYKNFLMNSADWANGFDEYKEKYVEALNSMDRKSANGFLNMATKVTESGGELDEKSKKIAGDILGAFDNLPSNMDKAGKDALLGLIYGMEDKIPGLEHTSEMTADEIVDTIKRYLDIESPSKVLRDIGAFAGQGLIDGLDSKQQGVIDESASIGNSVMDSISSAFDTVYSIGSNLITGLWEGISSMATWLWNNVSGFFSGLWNGIKGFFGINSPSTLFRDSIGKNLVLGLVEGIEDEQKTAMDAMENMANDIASVTFTTAKADFSALKDELNNAVSIDGSYKAAVMTGSAYSGDRVVASQTFNNTFSFDNITINDGSDVEDIAHEVSNIIVSDIMAKGGAYS